MKKRLLLLLCYFSVAFAAQQTLIGGASNALYYVQEIIRKVCIVSGVALFFTGMMKYFSYRKNPIADPLSKVVWLIIIGALLFGLAYLPSPLGD